jgi:hypothetical protein
MNEEQATALGNEIIKMFNLKVDKKTGRVNTSWGTKTPLGVGLCVERIMEELEETA